MEDAGMKTLIDDKEYYGDKVRLIRKLLKRQLLDEYPEQFKWKFQVLYLEGTVWIEICRIDNYLHDKQMGSHIHIRGRKRVERTEMRFEEADKRIKEISESILREEFSHIVTFSRSL